MTTHLAYRNTRKNTSWLCLAMAFLCAVTFVASGCKGGKETEKKVTKSDFTSEAEAWADAQLAKMDTTQLIGQLLMPSAFTRADRYNLNLIKRYVNEEKVGGIVWLRGDTLSMRQLADTINSLSDIPLFMAMDAEWGLAMRLEGTEEYPKNYRLSSTSDDTLYDYGYQLGMDARQLGLNVILAPVLDVIINRYSVMYARSYGNDPKITADKGGSFARGIADSGVLPVAKHFPGLGATVRDSHKVLPVVNDDRATIEARDLAPFRQFVDFNLGGIMVGHVAMPALDSVLRPATVSPVIVNDLLRKEMKFNGLIFSDAMNMGAVNTSSGKSAPYVEALKAGSDVLIVPADTKKAIAEIRAAVDSGELPYSDILDKVKRVLFYKYTMRES